MSLAAATAVLGFIAAVIGVITAVVILCTALVWLVLRTALGIVNLYGSIRKLSNK